MDVAREKKIPQTHIADIFKEFTKSSRVLRSFTNLSNTVIQTALSGQNKFVYEILQNADDAFLDENQKIEVQFNLLDNYFVVQHNGKGFDYNDVERICDYASQIEEVKANDLSKTGYKGLGFKSLFNLSDCIYIHSNGYSFRYDKTYWSDPLSKPWQVIPIWCKYNELPLKNKIIYDQPVNFILKINDIKLLESQLRELVEQPDLLLFMHRINSLKVNFIKEKYSLERKIESFGLFNNVCFYRNQTIISTWISRVFTVNIPKDVRTQIKGASQYIYPDKIQNSETVNFTFALCSDESLKKIFKRRGLCYSTLPTQLHIMLPYHINSFFILNLDRTQLHENEWNEFLIYTIGQLQLNLLQDLAEIPSLKNYVIELLVREINHPYATFKKAFARGFNEVKFDIGWLPPFQGSTLLKLGKAWTDDTEFFKQNFQNIRDHEIYPNLISYDVRGQNCLLSTEVWRFDYDRLFNYFPKKYFHQLTKEAYRHFINFLYEKTKSPSYFKIRQKLKKSSFLKVKGQDEKLLPPKNVLLEENENPLPDFLHLNPVDNDYLPLNNMNVIKEWLVTLGARRLMTSSILRESILKWLDADILDQKINVENHIGVMNFLAKGFEDLTKYEIEKLKQKLLVLTESEIFQFAKLCYLPDAISIVELKDAISNEEIISSTYCMDSLKQFFIQVGVQDRIKPIDVLRKTIFLWITKDTIKKKLTKRNYTPIIEYIAHYYASFENDLTETEKNELKKFPVLTSDGKFQKAELCYFDCAIPHVKGLDCIIAKSKLVSSEKISNNVKEFLVKVGVCKELMVFQTVRKSIIKWIQEGDIQIRITPENHMSILEYLAEYWVILNNNLSLKEKDIIKQIPILTEGNTFRAAFCCYWPPSNSKINNQIPGLNTVVSPNKFASSDYNSKVIIRVLEDLGVHNICFTDIYKEYSDHLKNKENMGWFFSQLVNYWDNYKIIVYTDELLDYLKRKFESSTCLLSKNGKMFTSRELYFSKFDVIDSIVPGCIPLLEYDKLPIALETFLNFKKNLDLKCIEQLLEGLQQKQHHGEKETLKFFTTILEELKLKDKNEIQKYSYLLFSKENKLTPSKNLYYFKEKEAVCFLDSHYLKRIHGMSHDQMIELATLCGVNVLPFKYEIQFGHGKKVLDTSLKEFYLERLPFIVCQESLELNENPSNVLKHLYDSICAIELHQCKNIYIQYDFGYHVEVKHHFDSFQVYVTNKWTKQKTKIHNYMKKYLNLQTDITDIIDMDTITEFDKQEWLRFQRNSQMFNSIDKEFQELQSFEKKEIASDDKKIDHSYCEKEEKEIILAVSSMVETETSSFEDKTCEIFKQGDDADLIEESPSVPFSDENSEVEELLNFPYFEQSAALSSDDTSSSGDELNLQNLAEIIEQAKVNDAWDNLPVTSSLKTRRSSISTGLKVDLAQGDWPALGKTEKSIETSSVEEEFGLNVSHDTWDDLQTIPCLETESSAVCKNISIDLKGLTQDIWPALGDRQQPVKNCASLYSSSENLYAFDDQNGRDEKFLFKWLGEKYVFTFLQNHYKNKYSNARFDLTGGRFTLIISENQHELSHKIEIVWLNENKEKRDNYAYDMLLKKDDKIKKVIKVKSIDVENNDSINISHHKLEAKINNLVTENPQFKQKFCIYFVFGADDSSTTCVKELSRCSALYKIMPLKSS